MLKISEKIGFAVLLVAFGFLSNGFFEFFKIQAWSSIAPSETQRLQWETLLAGMLAVVGAFIAYVGAVTPYRVTQRKQKMIYKSRLRDAAEVFLAYTSNIPHKLIADSIVEDRDLLAQLQIAAKNLLEQMLQIPEAIFTEKLDDEVRVVRSKLLAVATEHVWEDELGTPARESVLNLLAYLDRGR